MLETAAGLLLVLVAGQAAETLPVARKVTCAAPAFTLTVPEGFADHDVPDGGADMLYMFVLDERVSGVFAVMLTVARLGSEIPNGAHVSEEKLRAQLPPEMSVFRIEKRQWKGLDLDAVWLRFEKEGMVFVSAYVPVPLKAGGIELRVSGTEAQQDLVGKYLAKALAGLDGETNWVTGPRATRRIARWITELILVALVFLAVRASIRRSRKKRAKASEQ